MPAPTTIVPVNKFSGLNTRDAPGNISDTELLECQNYAIGANGELVKRTGIRTLHDFGDVAITVIGHFQTSLYNQVLVRAGNEVYWTNDFVTWNLIAGGPFNNVEWGLQYADKFYMIRRDANMLSWDGVAMSALANTPQGSTAVVYRDRLFVANSFSNNPTRVYYSEIADFSDFAALGQFVDINQGDGDFVVALTVLQDNLVVFKSTSIWQLRTSPDLGSWSVENLNTRIGCVSKYSIKEVKGYLVFLADNGVYRTDLVSFTELSSSVRPIFEQQVNSLIGINNSSAAFWEDKYILVLQTFIEPPTWSFWSTKTWGALKKTTWGSLDAVYVWMVFNLRTGGWTHWLPAEAESMVCHTFLEIQGPLSLRSLLIGSRVNDGRLYHHGEDIYYDGTNSPYDCIVETKDFDLDTPLAKRGKRLLVDRQGEGPFSLYYIVDQEQTGLLTPGISFTSKREILPVVGPGFFTTLRIRATSLRTEPETLYGFKLEIIPKTKMRKGA
jgi:hypothetical protein